MQQRRNQDNLQEENEEQELCSSFDFPCFLLLLTLEQLNNFELNNSSD